MPDDLELSSAQRKEFFANVLSAFPSMSDLKRMVVLQMGENLDTISVGDNLQDVVLDLITWARARGKTRQLVVAAYEDNPGNPGLRAFAAALGLIPGVTPAELPVSPLVLPAPSVGLGNSTSAPKSSSNPLPPDDQYRLRDLMRELPAILGSKVSARIALLERAGLSPIGMNSTAWGDPPSSFAEKLLTAAANGDIRFETTRAGYTPLGAVLVQVIEEGEIGEQALRFIASTVIDYDLVDFRVASMSPKVRAFLTSVIAPASAPVAQKVIRQVDSYLDAKWLHDGNKAMRSVCRVDMGDSSGNIRGYGTGFLVGPSTVMTFGYMVPELSTSLDLTVPPNIAFRFGYTNDSDKSSTVEGLQYRLAQTNWLVASSPSDELDYVLLRVDGTPGYDEVGGEPRSWLTPQAHTFMVGEQLFIIHHPRGGPAKLGMSPNAVIGPGAKPGRIIYRATTEGGSGGAPCFTDNWELVAMHESSLLENKKEGITMSAILEDPKVRAAIGT